MCEACPVIDWAHELPTIRSFTTSNVEANVSDLIVWYDKYDRSQKPLVGGKNASLGEMMRAELPVPPGFALTTDAYGLIWRDKELVDSVNGLLQGLAHEDYAGNLEVSNKIRRLIETEPVPDEVVDALGTAYEALCTHCDVPDLPVAIRSSATAEDQPDASFAGQQDTFLWVCGLTSVIEHTRKCWSSLFTDRAIAYRHQMGYLDTAIAMSVAVQKMVDPIASGVAFTLNPTNGDRSQVAIDASWGLGEAVVSGEVTPDNFLVDKVLREVVKREISAKLVEYRLTDHGVVEKLPIDDDRRDRSSVTDEQLIGIAMLARRAEKHYGCPQDVEWAVDRHLPEGENIVMLQSRPETVWSQKKRGPIAKGGDSVSSIVSTLVSPLHTRD
ncbi:PEP/pyruvate-binding domain-containing protein [Ilumatobacter sp.]|uniref:PEP/pyruvate-binding domain-containing protein n=1 Tax=Ilumatobacter sp. TaxID=1967498 RepID=UPI003B526765